MVKTVFLVAQRLAPRVIISIYYFLKYKAKVSLRAEVDLSSKIKFGKDCVIGSFTRIKGRHGYVSFGDNCGVATGCFVSPGKRGIDIGKNAYFGPNVSITSSNYVFNKIKENVHTSRGIKVGDNVWVGANCSILDGSELSDNTVVNANSVINRKFPPNVILRGNPAEIIFEMKESKTNQKGKRSG